jgi:hypothetical protein
MARRPGKARSWAQGSKPEVQRFYKRLGNRQERRVLDEETRRQADANATPGRAARDEPAG